MIFKPVKGRRVKVGMQQVVVVVVKEKKNRTKIKNSRNETRAFLAVTDM